MNVCRKAKVIVTKKKEFNSKIRIFLQDFLALLKSLYVKSFIEKKTSWYDMRPLDQKGLNIWVWNCIKELCKESGEVLGLTSNHLKVGPPQTLRASPYCQTRNKSLQGQQGSLLFPKMEFFFYKSSYLRFKFLLGMQNWVFFYKKR